MNQWPPACSFCGMKNHRIMVNKRDGELFICVTCVDLAHDSMHEVQDGWLPEARPFVRQRVIAALAERGGR